MSLREDLEEFKKKIPEELQHMVESEAERLGRSGLIAKCLKAGDQAPSFFLPNQEGKLISSERLLAEGPLVVSFYRGGW
jgi:hypothetical protein